MSSPAAVPGPGWRAWTTDVAVAVVVLVVGVAVVLSTISVSPRLSLLAVVTLTAVAVGLCRPAPAAALATAWLLGVWQLSSATDLLVVELALAAVFFGCARWGSVPSVVASALSIPAVIVGALVYVALNGSGALLRGGVASLLRYAYETAPGTGVRAIATVVGLVLLAAPWLAGLALRFYDRSRTSQQSQLVAEAQASRAVRERDQAEEIARLRDRQAQLARDVHDVVGHSLATIITQADAGQYAGDTDTLRSALAGIASSARTSLADVRQVLTSDDGPTVDRRNDLDDLVHGVRASGHDVLAAEYGERRPLAPELATVSYRVLQEMLTNAIKHGSRREPIVVERHWEGELRIEVRNTIDRGDLEQTAPLRVSRTAGGGGTGVEGMRRRLESVGGRLDVRRRDHEEHPSYTATAWVPLRSGS